MQSISRTWKIVSYVVFTISLPENLICSSEFSYFSVIICNSIVLLASNAHKRNITNKKRQPLYSSQGVLETCSISCVFIKNVLVLVVMYENLYKESETTISIQLNHLFLHQSFLFKLITKSVFHLYFLIFKNFH